MRGRKPGRGRLLAVGLSLVLAWLPMGAAAQGAALDCAALDRAASEESVVQGKLPAESETTEEVEELTDASAATEGSCGAQVNWTLQDGVLTISGSGETSSEGEPFEGRTDIRQVVIREGVTSIDSDLFVGCSAVEEVSLPSSLCRIGGFAFYECSGLQSVSIPEGVSSIGRRAFEKCTALRKVGVPASAQSIANAFHGTPWEEEQKKDGLLIVNQILVDVDGSSVQVEIPSAVTGIGQEAFRFCTSIQSVTIPESVTDIDEEVFSDLETLTDIYYAGSQESWKYYYDSEEGTWKDRPVLLPGGATVHYGRVNIESVLLSETSLSLFVGDGSALSAQVLPADATQDRTIHWSSSAPAVASVDSAGRITALQAGETIITAAVSSGVSRDCRVTVRDRVVTAVDLSAGSITLPVGTGRSLGVTLHPDNATARDLYWRSSDPLVAAVDQSGKVSALSAGTARISVTCKRGGVSASCAVTVSSGQVSAVTLSPVSLSLREGERGSLSAKLAPESAADRELLWESSDSYVAAVDQEGTVSACRAGRAVITVTARDGGKSASAAVTVRSTLPFTDVVAGKYYYDPVRWAVERKVTAGVTATRFGPEQTCTRGQIVTFLYRAFGAPKVSGKMRFSDVHQSDYFYSAVLWAVQKGVTSGVDASHFGPGQPCTRAQGMTFLYRAITGKSVSGAKSIRLSSTSLDLQMVRSGESEYPPEQKIQAITDPAAEALTWSSSDESIASVRGAGADTHQAIIEGKRTGSVTITASTSGGKRASCAVRISSAGARQIAEAKKYSYQVGLLLEPFMGEYVLTTDNPDLTGIRLSLKKGASTWLLVPEPRRYQDVEYSDERTGRIGKDRYLLRLSSESEPEDFPGGEMSLEVDSDTDGHDSDDVPTGIRVSVPRGETGTEYLIRTFADPVSGSALEKLSAVQGGLTDLAVYPKELLDRSERSESQPWPALAASPYPEVGLSEHLEIYQRSPRYLLSQRVYPFVLDSLDFPGQMAAVAEKLDPSCEVDTGGLPHYLVRITTSTGESGVFGGAGDGSTNALYEDRIGKDYRLDGTDLAAEGMQAIREKLIAYGDTCDQEMGELYDQLGNEAIARSLPQGGWARVAAERYGGSAYAYFLPNGQSSYRYVSSCWVDGRYVGSHEIWEKGVKFSDLRERDVYLDGVQYAHTGADQWTYTDAATGQEKTLTYAQMQALGVDARTDTVPEHGAIFDGTAEPGTAF